MVAEDAVSPDVVRAFPEVPTVMPEVLTVVVPTVKVSALTLESVTVLKLGVSETPTVTVPFA
ncbi:unknown [Sutterella sp. CAG:351]|nr:unknown [Sutterella sp. CAG:351]